MIQNVYMVASKDIHVWQIQYSKTHSSKQYILSEEER